MKPSSRFSVVAVVTSLVAIFLVIPTRPASAKSPEPGKYEGKVGTGARIFFRVDRSGRTLKKLNVGVLALCQDGFGNLTRLALVASDTDGQRFRIKRNGSFVAEGQDEDGIRYEVRGKLKGRRKFTGTAELSMFVFSPFIGASELCASENTFSARKK